MFTYLFVYSWFDLGFCFFFKENNLLISLFLAVLGLFLLRGLSLVAESEDYSVAVVCSFLLVAVSLVGEHWV